MLTVKILNEMNLENNDDVKFLDDIKATNKEFYEFLINNFAMLNIIEVLKENKKCYLPSGMVIEIENDKFKISNIFNNKIEYTESIFNIKE